MELTVVDVEEFASLWEVDGDVGVARVPHVIVHSESGPDVPLYIADAREGQVRAILLCEIHMKDQIACSRRRNSKRRELGREGGGDWRRGWVSDGDGKVRTYVW